MTNKLLMMTWWCLATLLIFSNTVSGKTAKRDEIEQQLGRIRQVQDQSGMVLSNNQDFHDYLMVTS